MVKSFLIAALVFLAVGVDSAWAQLDKNTVRFVSDVLTKVEFDGDSDGTTFRWVTAPTLSTFGPSSQHPVYVKRVVDEINKCLPDKLKIQMREPGDRSATIQVHFAPASHLKEIAKQNEFEYVGRNWGFFFTRWNEKKEIVKAVVLIAEDKISGRKLQHYLLEEITQALGFPGDSVRFKDSVFYEEERQFGTAVRLSATDKKLIRFHYEHVPPGSFAIEVGLLMAKHW